MLKFLLVCAAFAALPIQAQTLSGRIVGADARPVPYANIGLKNRPAGTVSGRDGSFTLRIPDLSVRDTLRISCIGYAAREIPAAGHDARPLEIRLQEQPQTPLSPVITHIPRKRYTFGRSIGSNRFSAAFRAGQEGGEMGVKCKLGNLRGELQRVRLNLAGCKGVDTLHMRINVYAMRGDRIRKNLARGTGLFLGSGVGGRQDGDRRPAALRDIRKRRLPDLGREPDAHAGGGEILDSRPAALAHLHPLHESGAVEDAQGRGRAERRRAGGAGIGNRATGSVPAAERPALHSGHSTAAALCGLQIIC